MSIYFKASAECEGFERGEISIKNPAQSHLTFNLSEFEECRINNTNICAYFDSSSSKFEIHSDWLSGTKVDLYFTTVYFGFDSSDSLVNGISAESKFTIALLDQTELNKTNTESLSISKK
jgi:hypothetical protein